MNRQLRELEKERNKYLQDTTNPRIRSEELHNIARSIVCTSNKMENDGTVKDRTLIGWAKNYLA